MGMKVLERIMQDRVMAILRGVDAQHIVPVAEALMEGGIRLLEVPFNQREPSEAPALIRLLVQRFGGSLGIGAGTVLSVEQAEWSADAGAAFILSPNTCQAVIERTKGLGLVSIPGAATPSEMVEAFSHGADLVKLFPAGDLGLGYMKSVLAPLSHIPVLAVGGIDEENVGEWLDAGASAVGAGARLIQAQWIREGRYGELAGLAGRYVRAAMRKSREA
ncbi:MAG: Entner-Doudoroff aldolase [Paenibacillaceae bacterium]|jgi:2-dehydro-3-deoxyphosphogluconate aldolase/(4S)-4-hydroxy-2-oxoglutarate aldolase|nr:Entner-Doudoroff aldolase [Paenibacillaceae bacterium]